jgi:hypothetical protein
MYLKIAFNLLTIIFLVMIQFGFVSALPGVFCDINLLLIALVFVLFLFGTEIASGWTISLGFLKDAFSYLPFGLFILSFALSFFLAYFLLNNFFTNRSLYSFLALCASTIVGYKLVLYLLSLTFRFFGMTDLNLSIGKAFWLNEGVSLFLNLALATVIFYLINFLSKRLKPAFLLKR